MKRIGPRRRRDVKEGEEEGGGKGGCCSRPAIAPFYTSHPTAQRPCFFSMRQPDVDSSTTIAESRASSSDGSKKETGADPRIVGLASKAGDQPVGRRVGGQEATAPALAQQFVPTVRNDRSVWERLLAREYIPTYSTSLRLAGRTRLSVWLAGWPHCSLGSTVHSALRTSERQAHG